MPLARRVPRGDAAGRPVHLVWVGGGREEEMEQLRFDVATPLNPRSGDGKIALYISIGQAF